jgi:hypothetical protein
MHSSLPPFLSSSLLRLTTLHRQSLVPILRHHPNHLQEAFSRLFSAMSCGTGSFADPPELAAGTLDSQGRVIVSDFAIQVPPLSAPVLLPLPGVAHSLTALLS